MSVHPGALYPRAPLYLAFALLLIFAGFHPSYFSVFLDAAAIHHFHALSATAWVMLLIAQATLARRRRFDRHRALGRLSYIVAPLVVLSGLMATEVMLGRDDPFHAKYGVPLAIEGAIALGWFAVAFGLAIRHRRDVQLHARYMISTVILVLPAALARVIGEFVPEDLSFTVNFSGAYAVCQLLVLTLIVNDRRRGKVFAPYPLLLVVQFLAEGAFVAALGV